MHKKTFENLWCPWLCCCLSCVCNLGLGCVTVLIGRYKYLEVIAIR